MKFTVVFKNEVSYVPNIQEEETQQQQKAFLWGTKNGSAAEQKSEHPWKMHRALCTKMTEVVFLWHAIFVAVDSRIWNI